MKERKNRKCISICIMLISLLLMSVTAFASIDSLNISQIVQNGNDVYLYTDVLDYQGNVSGDELSADLFSVILDDHSSMPIQEAVYTQYAEGTAYSFCIDISRSVTEEEMSAIRISLQEFINSMKDVDYASIITIGQSINKVCDLTNDKATLISALETVTRSDDYTYLYQGLAVALDTQRMKNDTLPKRSAIVLFSDGDDDSDGAYGENDVVAALSDVHVPVYVVGLGKSANANLSSVSTIARSSGGMLMSYNNYDIAGGVNAIRTIMDYSVRLMVDPSEEDFKAGNGNHKWNVRYGEKGNNRSSSDYSFTLSMEDVDFSPKSPDELEELTAKNVTYEKEAAFDGEEKTTTIEVKNADGEVLTEGTDYTVTKKDEVWKAAGEYPFVVTGQGKYRGEVNLVFTIKGIRIREENVEYEDSASFTGEKQVPSLKVRIDGKTLHEETDYIIEYDDQDWTNAGKYVFTIIGIGEYDGELALDYEIKAVEITAEDVDFESELPYTGETTAPSVKIKIDGNILEENVDYTLDLGDKEWRDEGNYTFTIAGQGNYVGKVKEECAIVPVELSEENLVYVDQVEYNGSNQKPEDIIVMVGDKTLEEKTDYTLDFGRQDWVDAGEYTFTVNGKGNFRGEVTAYFTISPMELTSENVSCKDTDVFTGTEQKPTDLKVTANGKELEADADYVVKTDADTWVNSGTYKITVSGKGNYTGDVSVTYTIQSAGINADDVEYEKTVKYNGSAQEPTDVVITNGDAVLKEGTDFTIVRNGEGEWINAGKYSFTIVGAGNYDDELELPFEIEPAPLSLEQIEYENEAVYTGSDLKPTSIVVRAAGNVLEEGKDYTVDFGKNDWVEAGDYTFTVTGKGNYTGSVTADYVIWSAKTVKLKNAVVKFAKENTEIVLAGVLALLAIIAGIIFALTRKKKDASPSLSSNSIQPMPDETIPDVSNGEETIAEYGDEETIGQGFDEEATTEQEMGKIHLSFEITFDGRTQIIERNIGDRDKLILGRGDTCDIDVVLGSMSNERKMTSRNHAVIESREEGLYILDKSKNKTYLNNMEVRGEEMLRDGDILMMGAASVRVRVQLL